jgi:type II secretory pathway component PulK
LLTALGIPAARADSMVEALLDWRETGDVPRPHGAKRGWYASRGLFVPRNGPLADVRELRRVRGFDSLTIPDAVLATVFTVEPGRLVGSRAPQIVLASVPSDADEAQRLTTDRPDAWVLTARAHAGRPGVTATIAVRVELVGTRATIARWRVTP